jgi:putative DNA primase/helicase
MKQFNDIVDEMPLMIKAQASDVADLVYLRLKDLVISCNDKWYVWNENYWQELPERLFDAMSVKVLIPWTKTRHADFKAKLRILMAQEININPMLVALKNCVYDLKSRTIAPGAMYKNQYLVGSLKINYEPNSGCPKWLAFLQEVMQQDKQKIDTLQEFFGYCFIGDCRYQKALVLLGSGKNGKSVVINILASLFDKVTRLDLRHIEDEKYIGHLQGSWLNVATELAYKSLETTANIKSVIAGEPVMAAPKYDKGFVFTPRAKIAFATNGLPRNNDTSEGYFRRFLIIEMDFVPKDVNVSLESEILTEKSGIFEWALQGLARLVKRGTFDYETQVMEGYKEESSALYSYWKEEAKTKLEEESMFKDLTFTDFYNDFRRYCAEAGMRPAGRNKLRSEIERMRLPVNIYVGSGNIKYIKVSNADASG